MIDSEKKLWIPDSEISVAQNLKLNQKYGKSLRNVIPLKNIMLGFMKLIFIFMNIMKKIQAGENGHKYMLFRINIYFSECFLAIEIDEKEHTDIIS